MTKYAVVTGSTSGIGKAFAEKLAKEKYNLILVSRDESKLLNQQTMISKEYDVVVYTIAIDLTERGAAKRIYTEVTQRRLVVEILINNAGFNECGTFLETDIEKEVAMIQLHSICTTELMKFFLPSMVEKKYGRIINLGSTGSYMACPNDAVYAATKAYILQMSKGINAELKGTGVVVTTLCPGSTKTAFASKAGMESTLLFTLFVMEPETVADIGYRAMLKGRTSIIVGLYNKLLVFTSKITPSTILNSLTQKMLTKS